MKSDSGRQLHYLQQVFIHFILFFIIMLSSLQVIAADPYLPKDGDIIFQESNSAQANILKLATKSRYNHVGIIFTVNNTPYVYEAINTVRYTKLSSWIARGRNQHFVVKRLKDSSKLTEHNINLLKKEAKKYEGKADDVLFSWSDKQFYCSELVWKIYYGALDLSLSPLEKIIDMDLSSPMVQNEINKRYGDVIPENATIITPSAIFASNLLVTVAQGKKGPY